MVNKEAITGVILAGGESSRMGYFPKGLLEYEGKTFVDHIKGKLSKYCSELILSANDEAYEKLGMNRVKDFKKKEGPLAGIYSVLTACETDFCFIVPCDMPLISEGLLGEMVKLADYDLEAVITVAGNKIQPMPLLIKTELRDKLKAFLEESEKTGVIHFLKSLNYKILEINEDEAGWINVNSKEDLEKLKRNGK